MEMKTKTNPIPNIVEIYKYISSKDIISSPQDAIKVFNTETLKIIAQAEQLASKCQCSLTLQILTDVMTSHQFSFEVDIDKNKYEEECIDDNNNNNIKQADSCILAITASMAQGSAIPPYSMIENKLVLDEQLKLRIKKNINTKKNSNNNDTNTFDPSILSVSNLLLPSELNTTTGSISSIASFPLSRKKKSIDKNSKSKGNEFEHIGFTYDHWLLLRHVMGSIISTDPEDIKLCFKIIQTNSTEFTQIIPYLVKLLGNDIIYCLRYKLINRIKVVMNLFLLIMDNKDYNTKHYTKIMAMSLVYIVRFEDNIPWEIRDNSVQLIIKLCIRNDVEFGDKAPLSTIMASFAMNILDKMCNGHKFSPLICSCFLNIISGVSSMSKPKVQCLLSCLKKEIQMYEIRKDKMNFVDDNEDNNNDSNEIYKHDYDNDDKSLLVCKSVISKYQHVSS